MIQPTSQFSGYNRADAVSTPAQSPVQAEKTSPQTDDRLSSANTDALREALNNTSEIRPAVVKRGHELAIDPNYPPRELIERLSKLMIESRDLSESS